MSIPMSKDLSPANERERIESLYSYGILDSANDQAFDNITLMSKEISGCPISYISFLDSERQWFKSKVGIEIKETSRADSYCKLTILNPEEPLIIEDTMKDKRLKGNPFVSDYRAYLGIPLVNKDNLALGSLCLMDTKPRKFDDKVVNLMVRLGKLTIILLDHYRTNKLIEDLLIDLDGQNERLNQFTAKAAHDMKSPVRSINQLLGLYESKKQKGETKDLDNILKMIKDQSVQASNIVDSSLGLARDTNEISSKMNEEVVISEVFEEVKTMLKYQYNQPFKISLNNSIDKFTANRIGIKRILLNLLSNSIKHNDKEEKKIQVFVSRDEDGVYFQIDDNGPGIARHMRSKLFEIYRTESGKKKSSGIGLSTVKELIEMMQGKIEISKNEKGGARFNIEIPLRS